MAHKSITLPENVAKYAVVESKLYKSFINYLRHRVGMNDEFKHIPLSESIMVTHRAAYHTFFDIDCLEGLYEYNWNEFALECQEFKEYVRTIKTGIHKIGCKELCSRFNLDWNKVKVGYKRLNKAFSSEQPKFTKAVLEKLTWDIYRELDAKMEQFKREIEEHEKLVDEIRAAIEENPELEEQGEAAIHNINQMIDWKTEAYDYLYANS